MRHQSPAKLTLTLNLAVALTLALALALTLTQNLALTLTLTLAPPLALALTLGLPTLPFPYHSLTTTLPPRYHRWDAMIAHGGPPVFFEGNYAQVRAVDRGKGTRRVRVKG